MGQQLLDMQYVKDYETEEYILSLMATLYEKPLYHGVAVSKGYSVRPQSSSNVSDITYCQLQRMNQAIIYTIQRTIFIRDGQR